MNSLFFTLKSDYPLKINLKLLVAFTEKNTRLSLSGVTNIVFTYKSGWFLCLNEVELSCDLIIFYELKNILFFFSSKKVKLLYSEK